MTSSGLERLWKRLSKNFMIRDFFDNYNNTDEVIKEYLLIENNERRRPDLVELDEDNVIQGFYSYIQFEK